VTFGDITEIGSGIYLSETLRLGKKWNVEGAFRHDRFYYRYDNRFKGDTSFAGTGEYNAHNHKLSPKLNIRYQAAFNTQAYLSFGKGFHTNDARVVVQEGGSKTLPSAFSVDLGLLYKPVPNSFLQAAVWYIYLQQEYVYAGDGGTVEFNGRTRRVGFDLSGRYELAKAIYFDVDVNFAHGRSLNGEKGKNRIPLAPVWSSTGGVNVVNAMGWNGSLRYRFLSKRPANADYSLTCAPYFVNDLVVKNKHKNFEYGLVTNNLFNVRWKETVFETETRLQNEPVGINGLSFTPGTKFDAKVNVAWYFGDKINKKRKKD
jgi:outer membrane receptor for monomeric catechols